MAALESANFALRFSSHLTLNSNRVHPRRRFSSSFGEKFNRKTPKCSLVEQQKQEEKEVSRVFTKEENVLIDALIGIQGRGRSASPQQLQEVESAVQILEGLNGTSDPRTFVGVDSFSVFQEVYLRTDDPRVSNIVKFSDALGELKVEAVASIKDGKRILFQFDRAAFSFNFLPFKVPYPVPFRLLGDEAKGWLDTTYLSQSGNIRISRGNKAIDEFITLNQDVVKNELELLAGEWEMIWSSQVETDSWIENAANGLMGKQVPSRPSFFTRSGFNTYDISMDDAAIVAGPYGLPAEMESKFTLELLGRFSWLCRSAFSSAPRTTSYEFMNLLQSNGIVRKSKPKERKRQIGKLLKELYEPGNGYEVTVPIQYGFCIGGILP
ncbi:putative plastid-lipid-associated protein 12 [Forsythia ovata]|uniref:Plastid-lipid-associated protein 12 n=1 Tax=Forsythia ovata TaxID=205694 RepID=A0ABD1RHL1_9LAMI